MCSIRSYAATCCSGTPTPALHTPYRLPLLLPPLSGYLQCIRLIIRLRAVTSFSSVESGAISAVCAELFANKVQHIVDVGGGAGALAAAIKAATGAPRATVTDLAAVVENRSAELPGVDFKVRARVTLPLSLCSACA